MGVSPLYVIAWDELQRAVGADYEQHLTHISDLLTGS
jgi:hypothetical protein